MIVPVQSVRARQIEAPRWRAACLAALLAAAPLPGVTLAAQTAPPPARPATPAATPPAPQTPPRPAQPSGTQPPAKPGTPPAPATPRTPGAAAPAAPGAPAAPPPAGEAATPGPRAGQPVTAQSLSAAIDRLGAFEFPARMQASRTVRRAPAKQALPALVEAATKHKDGFVRFRALVLLAGFGDPQVRPVILGVLDDPNDRLRDVAYAFLERHPDPALAPQLIAKLEKETSEFVRPSLTRALAALGSDTKVQQLLLREAMRGQDYFRGSVIAALGAHKAAYAIPTLAAIARQDGPLQDDAVLALGRIGDKRALDTIAAQQRTAPRERQPALAAAICLLGVNCGSHENFLVQTLEFAVKNPGFQDLVRSTANGLSQLAGQGRESAWDILIDHGEDSVDPMRAPLAIALASAAVANPEAALAAMQRARDQKAALSLMRDGFDILEEDFSEEQFYVAIRRAYWKTPDGGPARKAAEALITTLEF